MHQLRDEAVQMKEALAHRRSSQLGHGAGARLAGQETHLARRVESRSWSVCMLPLWKLGALAGKVSGAGGGGFMMFLADPIRRADVVRRLAAEPNGRVELVPLHLGGGGELACPRPASRPNLRTTVSAPPVAPIASVGAMPVGQAVILVGGMGTRLGTAHPKPRPSRYWKWAAAPSCCASSSEVRRHGVPEILLLAGFQAGSGASKPSPEFLA